MSGRRLPPRAPDRQPAAAAGRGHRHGEGLRRRLEARQAPRPRSLDDQASGCHVPRRPADPTMTARRPSVATPVTRTWPGSGPGGPPSRVRPVPSGGRTEARPPRRVSRRPSPPPTSGRARPTPSVTVSATAGRVRRSRRRACRPWWRATVSGRAQPGAAIDTARAAAVSRRRTSGVTAMSVGQPRRRRNGTTVAWRWTSARPRESPQIAGPSAAVAPLAGSRRSVMAGWACRGWSTSRARTRRGSSASRKGAIRIGADADLAIVDPDRPGTIDTSPVADAVTRHGRDLARREGHGGRPRHDHAWPDRRPER